MWKDSYLVGVDIVDQQHKLLFEMVDGLVKIVQEKGNWEDKKTDCKKAIEFLKQYVVMHFKAEEGYQASIHYSGAEEHKKAHRKFTNEVLEYEKKLIQTDFDRRIAKQLLGTLTAWLIYHVADEDQKFAGNRQPHDTIKEKTLMQCFIKSIGEILERMVGIDMKQLSGKSIEVEQSFGDVFITVGVVGEIRGSILYGFSKEFALNMMKTMTMMDMEEVDEMVCSAMAEISNIISGNAAISLAGRGFQCDITTPVVSTSEDGKESKELKAKILVQSPMGELSLGTTFLG